MLIWPLDSTLFSLHSRRIRPQMVFARHLNPSSWLSPGRIFLEVAYPVTDGGSSQPPSSGLWFQPQVLPSVLPRHRGYSGVSGGGDFSQSNIVVLMNLFCFSQTFLILSAVRPGPKFQRIKSFNLPCHVGDVWQWCGVAKSDMIVQTRIKNLKKWQVWRKVFVWCVLLLQSEIILRNTICYLTLY